VASDNPAGPKSSMIQEQANVIAPRFSFLLDLSEFLRKIEALSLLIFHS
jgi:hypothetical protein